MQKYLLALSVLLYIASLFLPGIVYVATEEDNPKTLVCGSIQLGLDCEVAGMDHACGPKGSVQGSLSQEEARMYCGDDWRTPRSHIHYGYLILVMGWLGIFIGTFAWYANLFLGIGLIYAKKQRLKEAFMLVIIAPFVGSSAFFLHEVPRNEGGVNSFVVAHLGVGYYLWMASLIFFCVYLYFLYKNTKATRAETSSSAIK